MSAPTPRGREASPSTQVTAPTGGDEGTDRPRLRELARLEALDGIRSRRQLLLRTITPIVLFAVVLTVSLGTRSAPGTRTDPYVVAVQGDLAGAQRTLSQLSLDRLRFVASDDATLDAARTADIGMQLPDQLDERVARGEPATIILFETAMAAESRSAAAHIRAGFGAVHQARVREALQARSPVEVRGTDTPTAALVTLDVIDVQRNAQSTQFQAAGLVAAIILLQASMLVGSTATRLLSRHNRGLLTAQLLLPFERWRLALSKGLAELLVGGVAAVPIVLLAIVVIAWSGIATDGWLVALAHVAVLVVAFVVLAAAMTSFGLFVGSVCRTQEQVSLASAVIVVVTAVVASQVVLVGAPPGPGIRLVPVVGLVQSTQGLLLGRPGELWWFLVGALSTLALATVLVRAAGRAFDAERLVLRGSS